MGALRAAWQDIKKRIDTALGKGTTDKIKTKLGDELDRFDRLLEKGLAEQRYLAKAAAELEATIAEIKASRGTMNVAVVSFENQLGAAKGLDPKLQKQAIAFVEEGYGRMQNRIRSDVYDLVKNAYATADKVKAIPKD